MAESQAAARPRGVTRKIAATILALIAAIIAAVAVAHDYVDREYQRELDAWQAGGNRTK